jgi:FlaA1/EpsC-like NDP-sugar epimerase
VEDIATGRVRVTDLRPLDVNDLLGREKVPANSELLARKSHDRSILVTGAGGSVGSELVRQLIKQGPRRLVLFDVSEAALYEIEQEALGIVAALSASAPRPQIVAVLGSVLDASQVREALERSAGSGTTPSAPRSLPSAREPRASS